jgi:amino-acid N-acetyltransferase
MGRKRTSSRPPGGERSVTIEGASEKDLREIAALLGEAGLAHEDIAAHVNTFLVARVGGEIVGTVGAEICDSDALLRSLVVAPTRRGTGLGKALVAALDRAAMHWGIKRWWLLTTTAGTFFTVRGFEVVERSKAPAAIRQTRQFQGGCACSAVCMTRAVERRAAAV